MSSASTPGASSPPVLALVPDLLFASRIRAAAHAAGVEVLLPRGADALVIAATERAPRRILLDLDARGLDTTDLIRRLKSDPRTRALEIVAFVSHVNEAAITAARAAGADRILARSAFVRQLAALVV